MKIGILGATGWIGGEILAQAINRGYELAALVRDRSKLAGSDLALGEIEIREIDLSQPLLASTFAGLDVVIAAIGGRAGHNHELVAATAIKLLALLPSTQVTRLLWVGGAGSLEVAPGVSLVSTAEFPAEYKAEALAQGEALGIFQAYQGELNWTFVSPAAEIYPGDSQGTYRVGGDDCFTDENGRSHISVTDYACAMLDELDSGEHPQQRISIAY
ncbi:putative NADH-flavin reductase [Shewanella denitrificans OS217]|uniref:Putative NADH-flavin reductase n=1 Tax=Shewanella denitrificans (strain OS217 / ATCC BAA-1090 / DSM 15013) TaxID=318161 RepID=Q12K55_SHEDO|nr:NAD(P)-dependent oxidoreductase [Shewanella denitrificans]ABE56171.1 putative NADH-flavin reductase [Shewanella denitrificans OS217]